LRDLGTRARFTRRSAGTNDVPYIVAIVDLEDDVCMNAQMRGVPVQVIFERTKEGLTLPAFVRTQ
jgi:hypothetical protein